MPEPSPFDKLAATYDTDFTQSAIGRMQRNRVWSFLNPVLREKGKPLNILEINCGTGDDALQMASLGHKVTATDASDAMIQKANEKIYHNPDSGLVQFLVCPFEELKTTFTGERFDLIFSNFGGLNCISNAALEKLGNDLASLLNPGGKLFLVLLSNACAWEMLHFGIRLQFGKAFRRFKRSSGFRIAENRIEIFYYSPGKLKKLLSPFFRLQHKFPAGLFIPPSYLEKKFTGKTKRLNMFNRLENDYGFSCLSAFGDHYCAIFKIHEPIL